MIIMCKNDKFWNEYFKDTIGRYPFENECMCSKCKKVYNRYDNDKNIVPFITATHIGRCVPCIYKR